MGEIEARRMPWAAVPAELRDAVADMLGSPIVETSSQPGGFSPGSADRVVTASGRRAFVKTASAALNVHSVQIHRSEAAMAARLPASAHAPQLLGFVDQDDWVAVVLEDVEGRHPQLPWVPGELESVLDALADLASDSVDGLDVPTLEETTAELFASWRALEGVRPAQLPLDGDLAAWVVDRLPFLSDAAGAAGADLVGDRLVHRDVRADNILIRPDGRVVLVDWPWVTRGVAWFDALSLLVNVRLYEPASDVERIIREHRAFDGMDPDAATRVLCGFGVYFLEAAMRPPIPALPTLRRFQLDQSVATLHWARSRIG